MYVPDDWIILKIEGVEPKPFYKVLGGWSGGYADSDRWRLNSGIEKIEDTHSYYNFIGSSGSIYKCHKGSERARGVMVDIIYSLSKLETGRVSIVSVGEAIAEVGNGSKTDSSSTEE